MMPFRALVAGALLVAFQGPALAQSSLQPNADESVSSQVTNPIAFLTRITAENKYSPSLWNSKGEENQVEGTFVIPFQAFARQNLARAKITFETSKPDGTHGLTQSQIFELVLFERNWGTFGTGISVEMEAQTSKLGALAPGPAIGAVAKRERWKYGLLNQNFLSDTLSQSELQPILSYAFNAKWSSEIGDAQYTYDWKKGRVTLIPVSGQLNRIVSLETQDIHLFVRGQYNAKNESGSDKWTISTGISVIGR